MKRLITTTVVITASLLAGCSPQESEGTEQGSAVGTTARKVIDGRVLPTSPVNLLVDPGFQLSPGSYGGWIVFTDDNKTAALWASTISAAPAGFGGRTVILTSKKARLVASFLGGSGPFVAQVWVSTSNKDGDPNDSITSDTSITAGIATGFPDGEVIELARVPEQTKKFQSRTWVLLRGEIRRSLPQGGYMVISSGTFDGRVLVSAPEVTTKEVSVGMNVRSLVTSGPEKARPIAADEARSLQSYGALTAQALPPVPEDEIPTSRLVPR